MKFIWEAEDFTGEGAHMTGTIVTENGTNGDEYWMIGARPAAAPPRFCLISLRDGMIQDPMTAEDFARHLNETNKKPISERSMIESYVKNSRTGRVIPL